MAKNVVLDYFLREVPKLKRRNKLQNFHPSNAKNQNPIFSE